MCFSGSLVRPGASKEHGSYRGADACASSQRWMVKTLDPHAVVFAVVNPCRTRPSCWAESMRAGECSSTQPAPQCANLSRWAEAIGVRYLHTYGDEDNALQPNGCASGLYPPNASSFYHQFWGWKQCLLQIRAAERSGSRFDAVVHARPDMCFRSGTPAHVTNIWNVLREAQGAIAVAKGKPNPLACTDSFGVVPRRHADVYLSTIDQYFKCERKSKWERFIGSTYREYFGSRNANIPGEPILGKQLTEYGIPWRVVGQLRGLTS